MSEPSEAPGFGSADSTDGRTLYEWKSKWEPTAVVEIRGEAIYLGFLLAAAPFGLVLLWLETPKYWLGLADAKYLVLVKFGFAWLAGTLGGTLFGLKWLYHSVARGSWHLDRRLWRIFTPHISGGLSFAVITLVSSGLLRIFDSKATESSHVVVGLSFLVGYFSDTAIAKLYEIADTIFGPSKRRVDGPGQS